MIQTDNKVGGSALRRFFSSIAASVLLLSLVIVGCKKDSDDSPTTQPVTYQITLTFGDYDNKPVSGASVKFIGTNQTYNATTDANGKASVAVQPGTYKVLASITLKGEAAKAITGKEDEVHFNGTLNNVTINATTSNTVSLALVEVNTARTLLIKQVYLGSSKADGANGRDQFIEIYNPTDKEISLEGYAIARAITNNTTPFDWTKVSSKTDANTAYFYSQEVLSFPAGAKIGAGESIFIARDAQNHKEAQKDPTKAAVIPDLSKAQFEALNPRKADGSLEGNDTDNPAPNMVPIWFGKKENKGTLNLYVVGDGLAIIKASQTDIDGWEKVAQPTTTGSSTGTKKFVQIPLTTIIDGVNVDRFTASKNSNFGLPATVDAGYIKPSGNYNGKSYIRKSSGASYKDTNNSNQDFEKIAHPDTTALPK